MNWSDPVTAVLINLVISGIVGYGVASFRIGRYTEKVDQLEKCNLNQRLATLEGEFKTSHNLLAGKFIQSKSPFMLTVEGSTLLNDSGGKQFVDVKKELLIEAIKNKKPQSAYDVQEFARSIVSERSNDPEFKAVKDYLFKHGLLLELIVGVMGIYLRDLALDKLGFKPEDIDKDDRAKPKS